MWKNLAVTMSIIAVLSVATTAALALEVRAMNATVQGDIASMTDRVNAVSQHLQAHTDSETLAQENAALLKEIAQKEIRIANLDKDIANRDKVVAQRDGEIARLTAETQSGNGDRFHHSRDIRDIVGQFNGSEMALDNVSELWEECIEERMGLMGAFYAADMVDWWENDYWRDLTEDGRMADLLYTGRIHGCWN